MSAAATARRPFPFTILPTPTFEIRCEWQLADLTNYIGTWSAVQRCRDASGHDPIIDLMERPRPAWGDPARRRKIRWPIALLAGYA